jgi:hypothetical protein
MVFSEIENASGDSKFDCIADLMPDKDNLRVRVRILRLWKVPAFLNPLESSSMEMVLVDDKVKFIVDNFLLMCVMYVFLILLIIGSFYRVGKSMVLLRNSSYICLNPKLRRDKFMICHLLCLSSEWFISFHSSSV